MGTHPSCPSYTRPADGKPPCRTTLSEYLSQHKELLSDKVIAHYKIDPSRAKDKSVLPFLFKVLSVGKALSIQAHPDRQLAQKLHAEKPNMYKDDNHKPEMAIAITDFRGFCGFRPLKETVALLNEVPEFKGIVAPPEELLRELAAATAKATPDEEAEKKLLRDIFGRLMKASDASVAQYTAKLAKRYESGGDSSISELERSYSLPALCLSLQSQFPNDVGIFCAFLLNHLSLSPGQALFLGANEPHAYLQGEIVECMAASDNVVRAGLTPKARDVDVLVDMLTYRHGPSQRQYMQPSKWPADNSSGASLLYEPPIDEFNVLRTALSTDTAETHRAIRGPSILIVTQGEARVQWPAAAAEAGEGGSLNLKAGNVLFVGANCPLTFTKIKTGEETVLFRAFVEI